MPPPPLRNRIKDHRKVRLGDLAPHELNPRIHSPAQREILTQLYGEVGFARSVLAYELPDGRLKLIDGHLRAALTPDEVVDVEVLDVTEAEARVLLLSLDPLAQLAAYEEKELAALRELAEKDSAAVQLLWQQLQNEPPPVPPPDEPPPPLEDQYLVLIECASEAEQVQLLRRFKKEGLSCKAKVA
jgi:hypothetical protein